MIQSIDAKILMEIYILNSKILPKVLYILESKENQNQLFKQD